MPQSSILSSARRFEQSLFPAPLQRFWNIFTHAKSTFRVDVWSPTIFSLGGSEVGFTGDAEPVMGL